MQGNMDDLERRINEYLDGTLTDGELQNYLAETAPDIDFDKMLSFKDRVERIEELYRQIEEPDIPSDYWDTFSERVISKLPDSKREDAPSFLQRIFTALFPSGSGRAVKFAGVAAAILLVAIVGDRLLDEGELSYDTAPAPIEKSGEADEDVSMEKKLGSIAEKSITGKGSQIELAEPEAEEKSIEVVSDASEQLRDDVDNAVRQKSQDVPIGPSAEEEIATTDVAEPEPEKELKSPEIPEPKPEPEVEITVESNSEESPPALKRTADISDHITIETNDMGIRTEALSMSIQESAMLWVYDTWTLDKLQTEIKDIEQVIEDLTYGSEQFVEYAKMKSSLAIMTRDSVDIYDAMNTIDSVIVHQSRPTDRKWMERKSQLQRLRERIEMK